MKRIFMIENNVETIAHGECHTLNVTGKEIKDGTEIYVGCMKISIRNTNDMGTILDVKYSDEDCSHIYDVRCNIPLNDDTVYLIQWIYNDIEEEMNEIGGGNRLARITNI